MKAANVLAPKRLQPDPIGDLSVRRECMPFPILRRVLAGADLNAHSKSNRIPKTIPVGFSFAALLPRFARRSFRLLAARLHDSFMERMP